MAKPYSSKTKQSSTEGKNGLQFRPPCVVSCPVRMLAPSNSRIYSPALNSRGIFVQSERFVESHGGLEMRDRAKTNRKVRTQELGEAKTTARRVRHQRIEGQLQLPVSF